MIKKVKIWKVFRTLPDIPFSFHLLAFFIPSFAKGLTATKKMKLGLIYFTSYQSHVAKGLMNFN